MTRKGGKVICRIEPGTGKDQNHITFIDSKDGSMKWPTCDERQDGGQSGPPDSSGSHKLKG